MSKLKRLLIATLAVCSAACFSLSAIACDKSSDYPDYKNPSTIVGGNGSSVSNVYTINVKSQGGLSLSDVKVAIKKNGATLYQGISQNGKITLPLEPDVYDLVVDESTLPAGYYIPEGTTWQTTADSNSIDIQLPSKIISTSAPSSKRYALGDVMYDFSYTDTDGSTYTLSQTLADKKAVILNFWYSTCGPCKSEFPVLQSAYFSYSDKLEVVALDSTDSSKTIKEFKEQNDLELRMAQDVAGITNLFNVTAFPTTVIVDRFGVVAYIDTGAITDKKNWTALFSTYTSDDYVQNTSSSDSSNGGVSEAVRVKPTIEMPDTADIALAINGSGTEGRMSKYYPETSTEDAEYSWPWIVGTDSTYTGEGNGQYIAASNVGVDASFATIYVDVSLKAGDILSYEYNYITQQDSDYLYVIIDNSSDNYKVYSGDSDGWQTEILYTATRTETLQIAILYSKSDVYSEENERVWIGNFKITNAQTTTAATDIFVSAVDGAVGSNGYYESYQTVKLNPDDGYYHIYDEKTGTYGALLMADILNATSWSDLHVGGKKFVDDTSSSRTSSLYNIAFWSMSNYKEVSAETADTLLFQFDTTKGNTLSTELVANYYYQGFSDNGYIPVDEEVKELLVEFTKYYFNTYEKTKDTKYDVNKTWLELCYYGKHYGGEHLSGETCSINVDPIKALSYKNAYNVTAGVTYTVDITHIITYNGGGLFYKFVPTESGIYKIATGTAKDKDGKALSFDDPVILLLDADRNRISYLNNNDSPDTLDNYANRYHVYDFAYLEAGETYYLQCTEYYPQNTSAYTLTVSPLTDASGVILQSYDYLRIATTDDGAFNYDYVYSAIDYALNTDGIYYAMNSDNTFGSKIYIDFVHQNFLDGNGHTVYEFIQEGIFDLTKYGDQDYTQTMNEYYAKAIDKDKDDELYGMTEATEELVKIIAKYLEYAQDSDLSTGYWLSLATYYQHIGK